MNYEVDIVVLENGDFMANALRPTLEYYGAVVRVFWIGQPKHCLQVFSPDHKLSEYVIICGHGDEEGFIFGELCPEVQKEQPWENRMNATHIKEHLNFNNSHIIANGCVTGTDEIAEAILQKKAKSYLAPTTYINGNSDLKFQLDLFFQLFEKKKTLEEAVSIAKKTDKETASYKLWRH